MKEIGDWMDETYLKFTEQENKEPRRSASAFLQSGYPSWPSEG